MASQFRLGSMSRTIQNDGYLLAVPFVQDVVHQCCFAGSEVSFFFFLLVAADRRDMYDTDEMGPELKEREESTSSYL